MKTRLILKPGHKGTKAPASKYGDALVCVRFRYDAKNRQRLKTAELGSPWTPPEPRYQADMLVPLRIKAYDMASRAQVKEAGGRWDPEKRLWFARYRPTGKSRNIQRHLSIYS